MITPLDYKPKCGFRKQISSHKFFRIYGTVVRSTIIANGPATKMTDTVAMYNKRAVYLKSSFFHEGLMYSRVQDLSLPAPECFTYYRYDLRRL